MEQEFTKTLSTEASSATSTTRRNARSLLTAFALFVAGLSVSLLRLLGVLTESFVNRYFYPLCVLTSGLVGWSFWLGTDMFLAFRKKTPKVLVATSIYLGIGLVLFPFSRYSFGLRFAAENSFDVLVVVIFWPLVAPYAISCGPLHTCPN